MLAEGVSSQMSDSIITLAYTVTPTEAKKRSCTLACHNTLVAFWVPNSLNWAFGNVCPLEFSKRVFLAYSSLSLSETGFFP